MFLLFFVKPHRVLHSICIIPRNIFWEMLNNVTDYRIIIIPKKLWAGQEAEQKESLYPGKLH